MGKKVKIVTVNSKEEPVRSHLVLLKYLIEGGPKTVRQIRDKFGWSDRTVRDRLAKLTFDGLVKEIKGGKSKRYAYYTYTDQKFMIRKLLLEKFSKDIETGIMHPQLHIAASRILELVDDDQFKKDLTDVFKELVATKANR